MSKFKGILDDIQAKQSGSDPEEETPPPPSPAPPLPVREQVKQVAEKRKPGRPKIGKSSNPEFVQVTAYVEESVLVSVKKALLDRKGTDFSDVVNDLLKKWIKSNSKSSQV